MLFRSIRHSLPSTGNVVNGKKNPAIVEMDSTDPSPKKDCHISKISNTSRVHALFIQELDNQNSLMNTGTIEARKNKLDCPHFDGYDFLE